MALTTLLQGAAIGFSIAAPVGPIGVLCIRRSLAEGRQVGLASGLGAATADAMYGCIAAFGLTAISSALVAYRSPLAVVGGLFLCYLGVRTFLSSPAQRPAESPGGGLASAYVSTLLLTLTNPTTILSFAAVFAGLGLAISPGNLAPGLLVAGVFSGSALWWLLLSHCVSLLRPRIESGRLRFINRVSGGVIFAFGIYSLVRGVEQ